jgi:hypothetical protein
MDPLAIFNIIYLSIFSFGWTSDLRYITWNIRATSVPLNVDLEEKFIAEFAGMCIIYFRDKFYIYDPDSINLLVTAFKSKAKHRFHAGVVSFSCVSSKVNLKYIYFPSMYYRIQFESTILIGSGVDPTSHICASLIINITGCRKLKSSKLSSLCYPWRISLKSIMAVFELKHVNMQARPA